MPQGLSTAPLTLKRLVRSCFVLIETMRRLFDNIFVHSRAEHGRSDIKTHIVHLQAVLELISFMPMHLSASTAAEISFLECFITKRGLREDLAIVDWPVPRYQKDLRKWLGLANHLNKYSANYAEMARQ